MREGKLDSLKDNSPSKPGFPTGRENGRDRRVARLAASLGGAVLLTVLPGLASSAEDQGNIPDTLDRREILKILREQQRELAEQRQILKAQEQKIAALSSHPQERSGRHRRRTAVTSQSAAPNSLLETRAVPGAETPGAAAQQPGVVTPAPSVTAQYGPPDVPNGEAPAQPVGKAPAQPEQAPEVPEISNTAGVLTPKGQLVAEPYLEYIRSTQNGFTFQGVQIINAFLIGQINAGRTVDDLVATGATVRYGITNRLSADVKVPLIYRANHFQNALVNAQNLALPQNAEGAGLGDIEAAVHYQLNDGRDDWPYFVAHLRYKSDSGKGPFDVNYNPDGSPQRVPTGSGFNAIQPAITFIYPSDPAVLFGGLGYVKSFGGSINRTIAGSRFGDVTPGDTYEANFGVGVALNDRLSFNLGYEHDYIQGTREIVNNAPKNTATLQVGQAHLGMAFKTSDTSAVNVDLATGVTRDAPDVQLTMRVPLTIDLFKGGPADSGEPASTSSSRSSDDDDDDSD